MTCDKVSKARTPNDTGFTLLEVLVSLSILGMIATVAFAGLSIGIDSWRRGSQRIEDLDRRFAVERLLQRQIALSDSHIFRGDNRQLEFSTSYSLANGPGDELFEALDVGRRRRDEPGDFLRREMRAPKCTARSICSVNCWTTI